MEETKRDGMGFISMIEMVSKTVSASISITKYVKDLIDNTTKFHKFNPFKVVLNQ